MPTSNTTDTFYILDFDRCIGNTNVLFDAFERVVVAHTGLTAWSLRNVRHEVEAVGDSFDTATYVRAQLHLAHHEDEWRKLEANFIESCKSLDTLNPGAKELISWLDEQNLPYGTVTYGEATWQNLKMDAAGLKKMPRYITGDKYKGVLFQEWRTDEGKFVLPDELGGGTYSSIVLVDDKAVSFDSFPELPSRGYWVLSSRRELSSQQGTVPDNVQRLESLGELLVLLKSIA